MSKLVIIDSMAILHRAYHAIPPLTARNGDPINAIYGLTSMLLKIITDFSPTHLVFTFDEKEKTFRQKDFPDYQVQRKPTPDDLSSQFTKAKDLAKVMSIPYYSKPGYEADDLIGSIANQVTMASGLKTTATNDYNEMQTDHGNNKTVDDSLSAISSTVIVTGDRDILQLVDDSKNIKLYMPIAGLTNAKLFGEKETIERMGVKPSQIVDYKALVGDPSDNYPGVPGIGPKTATTLLEKYDTFHNIYKKISEIKESVREKLMKGKDLGEVSYKLATIVRDVPIEFNFDEMKNWKVDSDKVFGLFEEYGFRSLTRRAKEVGEKIVSENQMKLL
jgi:DNA polymerase I